MLFAQQTMAVLVLARLALAAVLAAPLPAGADADVCSGGQRCGEADLSALLQVKLDVEHRALKPPSHPAPAAVVAAPAAAVATPAAAVPAPEKSAPAAKVAAPVNSSAAAVPASLAQLNAAPGTINVASLAQLFQAWQHRQQQQRQGSVDLSLFGEWTNPFVLVAILAAAGSTLAAGWQRPPKNTPTSAPAALVIAMMIGHGFLIMGWLAVSSTDLVAVRSIGQPLTITADVTSGLRGAAGESTMSLIRALLSWEGPSAGTRHLAGYAFAACAIGVPGLRIILSIFGEVLRNANPSQGRHISSATCLHGARVISKWVAPVFFCTVMLHCQYLAMDHWPLVSANAVLDLGFVGYFIYCMTSTACAFLVAVPQASPSPSRSHSLPCALRWFGRNKLGQFMLFVTTAYLALLAGGVLLPSFSFAADPRAFFPSGTAWASPVDWASQQALQATCCNIWRCAALLLAQFMSSWQATTFIAFLLVTVFGVLLPAVDMIALAVGSFRIREGANQQPPDWAAVSRAILLSRTLRPIAMLDMLVLGIVLGALSGKLVLQMGALFLIAAEALRYFVIYGVVESVICHLERHHRELSAAKFEIDSSS